MLSSQSSRTTAARNVRRRTIVHLGLAAMLALSGSSDRPQDRTWPVGAPVGLEVRASRTAHADPVREPRRPGEPHGPVGRPAPRAQTVRFEANLGQADAGVAFLARGGRDIVTLGRAAPAIDLALPAVSGVGSGPEEAVAAAPAATVRFAFEGARAASIGGEERALETVNYLMGGVPAAWVTDIPVYGRVRYRDLYDGIDLVVYGTASGTIEYDLEIAPGADPAVIVLRTEGVAATRLAASGELLHDTAGGTVRTQPPRAYQVVEGRQRDVGSRYVLSDDGGIGFALDDYDPSRPITIDPVIVWSRTLARVPQFVATLPDGGTVVGGTIPSAGAPLIGTGGAGDLFVTALDPAGTPQFTTYIGGASADTLRGLTADHTGIYLAGETFSSNFPLANPYQSSCCIGAADAFVAKLAPAGNALVYSTYLGGSFIEETAGIAVDGAQQAIVTGYTQSVDFPVVNAVDATFNGGLGDAFVTKFNAAGNALVYSTYLGGAGGDRPRGVAVAADGSATVVGETQSPGFPNVAAFQSQLRQSAYVFTADGGATWSGQPTTARPEGIIESDPQSSQLLYIRSGEQVFKSSNRGLTWSPIRGNVTAFSVGADGALYTVEDDCATRVSEVRRSTDGGATWPVREVWTLNCINGVKPPIALVADRATAGVVYITEVVYLSRSTDGGDTWALVADHSEAGYVRSVHPGAGGFFYYTDFFNVYKSTDPNGTCCAVALALANAEIDVGHNAGSTNTEVVHAWDSSAAAAPMRSTNGGTTWSPLPRPVSAPYVVSVAGDSRAPQRVLLLAAGSDGDSFTLLSQNGGGSWSVVAKGLSAYDSEFPSDLPAEIWWTSSPNIDAFVTRLSPTGALLASSFLGGEGRDGATAVAIGTDGRIHVAGWTDSRDFPRTGAVQPAHGGTRDAFLTTLDAAGTTIVRSTTLGGTGIDEAVSAAAGPSGSLAIAGHTNGPWAPNVATAPDLHATGGGSPGSRSPFFVKTAADGTVVFAGARNETASLPRLAFAPSGGLRYVGRGAVVAEFADACLYQVSPLTFAVGQEESLITIDVDANGESCEAPVTTDPGFMFQINSALPRGRDSQVQYRVFGNMAAPRIGTITIGGRVVTVSQAGTPTSGDTDGDALPDAWEMQFGLSPASGAGDSGAAGDPDGDGRTNLQEYQNGTHPRGFHTRYLAEGAVNTFFDVRLALLTTGPAPATVLMRFQQPGGATLARLETLPPNTRRTITRADLSGLTSPDFSTVVESDQPVVVDRTMSWDASGYGSHAETGVPSPATTWYLAEGSTSGDFALFYLIQNPNSASTTATVRYLRPFGQPPIERSYTLAGNSRTTIPVDAQGAELASTDVSAVVTAPLPIIVERAMYVSRPNQVFAAGHGSAGVTAPAASWFLAEGATGPFFDLFILLANPNAQAAAVAVDYLLSDGRTFSKSYTVPGNGRFTIWVDDEQIPAGSGTKPLQNVAVSSTITSTNGVPIIVERAMWWPGPAVTADFWTEAHNSPGATATGTRWALAEGEVGGPSGAETYVLIANTSAFGGEARVTLFFEDGGSVDKTVPLPPRSRTNVGISAEFPAAAGRRFATLVESLGATPAQIVVERAMYTSPGGVTWAAGTNALATSLP